MSGAAARLAAIFALIPAWLSAAAADPGRGERVFQRCYACHSVVAGEDKLPGPNLRCVLGRRAGTRPGFEFSPAGARGLVWTRATLEAFLADPGHAGSVVATAPIPARGSPSVTGGVATT